MEKLTDEDLRDVTEHPNAIEMALPNDRLACFQQLYDLVEIMIVDGMVRIKERELCTSLAVNLGFTPDAVDTIIQAILKGNLSSRDEKDIQADLIRKLL